LTWRLLFGLWPVQIHLEGNDLADRAAEIGRLCLITRAKTVEAAAGLFDRLVNLVNDYVPAGAHVTEATLQRRLVGIPLVRSSTCRQGWSVMDRLAEQLRDHTPPGLANADSVLELDRRDTREKLHTALIQIGPLAVSAWSRANRMSKVRAHAAGHRGSPGRRGGCGGVEPARSAVHDNAGGS
jgi:hypothetical protein